MLSNPSSSSASNGPNSLQQGIDTLTSALKSNIVPDQEYLLQGSVQDNHVEVLRHRLRGLCDNADAAGFQETFQVGAGRGFH